MIDFTVRTSVSLPDFQVFNFMNAMHGTLVLSRRNGAYLFSCSHVKQTETERWRDPAAAVPLILTAVPGITDCETQVFTDTDVAVCMAHLLSLTSLETRLDPALAPGGLTLKARNGIDAEWVGRSLLETRGVNV